LLNATRYQRIHSFLQQDLFYRKIITRREEKNSTWRVAGGR